MASTIRHDFSFPPKFTSLSNNQSNANNIHQNSNSTNNNNNNNPLSLTRSTSATILTNNNNINNNNNNNNLYCSNCNVNNKTGNNIHQHSHNNNNCILMKTPVSTTTAAALCVMNGSSNILAHAILHGAPVTPKDANCSFTFDELKNTLAFMEDSPIVSTNSIMTNTNQMIISNTATTTSTTSSTNTALMVEATTSAAIESSLSSSSSSSYSSNNSSTLSSSNGCSSCSQHGHNLQLDDEAILGKKSNAYQLLFNNCTCPHASNEINNDVQISSNVNACNLIETLLIKKSPTMDSNVTTRGNMSTSTSSNSISNNSVMTKSNSNHLLQAAPSATINSSTTTGFSGINTEIESAAKKYRCAAQISEATCSWKGKLPPKSYRTPIVYSTKVFVGGLPWDITEDDLVKEFGTFGPCRVEWTNKEKFNLLSGNNSSSNQMNNNNNNQFRNYRSVGNLNQANGVNGKNNDSMNSSKQRSSPGFAYVIYENEFSVRSLVNNCIEDYANGRDRVEFYFKISTRRVRNKEVQIIPWILADNNFALCTPKELDPKKTVFVGNLHGTMTARDLAHIMNELFGSVVYAGIDIDKLKYPIGSGRVTFANQQNFMRAVRAAFVDIQTAKFSKRIQIDPYLEDVQCCICYNEKGIYFCRDFQCFNYYCGNCWSKQHSFDVLGNHKPLMRKREEKL